MMGHSMRGMEGLAVHTFVQLDGAFSEKPSVGCSNFASFGTDCASGLGPQGAMPNDFMLRCRGPSQEHLFPTGEDPEETWGPWGFNKLLPLSFEKNLSHLGQSFVD